MELIQKLEKLISGKTEREIAKLIITMFRVGEQPKLQRNIEFQYNQMTKKAKKDDSNRDSSKEN